MEAGEAKTGMLRIMDVFLLYGMFVFGCINLRKAQGGIRRPGG